MSRKCIILCLLAVIVLASFFRLWEIRSIPPGFYPDEAMNGNNAMETWQNTNFSAEGGPALGWKVFYPENNGREGLWINMMAPLLAAFGNEPWVPRTMAAIIGILTVIGLYFLTKELFKSERIGLLASFFLAASFWHINFSRIGFRAILAPFFLVWSFYLLFKIINKFEIRISKFETNSKSQIQNSKQVSDFGFRASCLAGLSGLLFGLGFHTYISFRVAPLLLIIPFILIWRLKQKKLIFIFLFFTFITALPIGIYFLENPQDFFGRTSQLSIFSAASPLRDLGLNIVKTIGMFFVHGDYNWRHNFSGLPELWWPTAILFLIGIITGLNNIAGNSKHEARNPKQYQNSNIEISKQFRIWNFKNWNLFRISDFGFRILFIFSWLAAMLIPAVISNEGIPHALRSLPAAPAVMIFAALGLGWIIAKISDWLRKKTEQYPEKIKQLSRVKKELIVLLLLFLLAVASQSFNQYFFRWAPNPNVADAFSENYVKLGKYLNTLPKEIPKYVIVNAEGVDVRSIPMPAQTVMFVTKTFLPAWQAEKNIFYVNLPDIDPFISSINQKGHFYITMMEKDFSLYLSLKQKIPALKSDVNANSITLYK